MIASARGLLLLTVVGSWSCTLTEAFVPPVRLPRGRPCATPRPRVGAEATGLAVACGAQVGGDGGCPVAATRRWVEQAVIGMNLCPWARAAVDEGLVQIKLSSAMTVEGLLGDIEAEMRRLAPDNCRDTSIIVTGTLLSDLDDYLRVCDQVNDTIDRLGFDGVLQLATFHPDYQFAGTTRDDAGVRSCSLASGCACLPAQNVPYAQLNFGLLLIAENWTNRSPFPAFHILQESEVEQALESFKREPEQVWESNVRRMKQVGAAAMEKLVQRCRAHE